MLFVRAGDVGFTASESLLGYLIRWAETAPKEKKTKTNHTFQVLEDGEIEKDAILTEAVSSTRIGIVNHSIYGDTKVYMFRPIPPLTLKDCDLLMTLAKKHEGDKYGWWKLGFHLLDRLIFKDKKVLSKLLFIDSRPICSYYIAHLCAALRKTFGGKPEEMDPDTMMDYCEAHPNEWYFIGETYV